MFNNMVKISQKFLCQRLKHFLFLFFFFIISFTTVLKKIVCLNRDFGSNNSIFFFIKIVIQSRYESQTPFFLQKILTVNIR